MQKLIHLFLKETFISYYVINNVFYVQKQTFKKGKSIEKEVFQMKEEEFLELIKISFLENTQTYISTIIDTFNQGIVDSCNHSRYKELQINIDNIKILCIKNFSVFIGLYELSNFEKEIQKFKVDFIFSPYLLIDINKKSTTNTLYLFITKQFIVLMIYQKNDIPKYSNIYQIKIEEEHKKDTIEDDDDNLGIDSLDDDIEGLDDIADIEELDNLDDTLDDEVIDDIDDIDDISDTEIEKDDIISTKMEIETLEFIKNSIKDYYENYSEEFLEKLHIFYNDDITDNFIKEIENETLLEISNEKMDILSSITNLALKEINV